ncbi:MAG: hypothetical protein EHM28_05255 [Spirochaetaceae bacterium]|nr:MAG: hypothetical protein EHM28_05255 [Spirochaetaceae bacterium]
MGTAPLVMSRPEKISRLLFVLPGFNDEVIRVGPGMGENVQATLLNLKIEWSQIRDHKRNRYYSALAAFILSLPLPIFSFSFARDAWISGRNGEFEFYSTAYYWTGFISAALFVNMLSELLKYVHSADRPAG